MNRLSGSLVLMSLGVPRASGDEPMELDRRIVPLVCSPREWG